MHLDRMKTLSLISVVALSSAFGCSSKKNNGDDTATGGSLYVVGTGGSANAGATNGGGTGIDPNYCNGLLANANCGTTSARADVRTVNMMLVLDQSGSMKDKAQSTDAQSKWANMETALTTALNAVAKDINFGLILFPYSGNPQNPGIDATSTDPDVSCNVPSTNDPSAPVAVEIVQGGGLDSVKSILDTVRTSMPAGGTPTTTALEAALTYFQQGNGKDLQVPSGSCSRLMAAPTAITRSRATQLPAPRILIASVEAAVARLTR